MTKPKLGEKTRKELEVVKKLPFFVFPENPTPSRLEADVVYSGWCKKDKFSRPLFPGAYSFGEDTVWVETLFQSHSISVRVYAVADGHGIRGDLASREVIVNLRKRLKEDETFLWECRKIAVGIFTLKGWLTKTFLEIDQGFQRTGGTTLSLMFLLSLGNRHFICTANVGDSPMMLLSPQHDYLAFQSHSWDNVEERHEYIRYCRQHDLIPRDVILGRINTPSGMKIPHKDGSNLPWFLFKNGSTHIDHEMLEEFHEMIPQDQIGGVQSLRKMVLDEQTPHTQFYHENWGSTAYDGFCGRTQMTRSIGDIESKEDLHLRADPDFKVHELILPETADQIKFHIVLCSDGVGDLFYFHEWRSFLESSTDPRKVIQKVYKEISKRGLHPDFGYDYLGRPKWDDCSLIVGSITLLKKEGVN